MILMLILCMVLAERSNVVSRPQSPADPDQASNCQREDFQERELQYLEASPRQASSRGLFKKSHARISIQTCAGRDQPAGILTLVHALAHILF